MNALDIPVAASDNTNMKRVIVVALIMMGALLILTPTISDYYTGQGFRSLVLQPTSNLSTMYGQFNAKMGYYEQLGYWTTGVVVICTAFLVRRRRMVPTKLVKLG